MSYTEQVICRYVCRMDAHRVLLHSNVRCYTTVNKLAVVMKLARDRREGCSPRDSPSTRVCPRAPARPDALATAMLLLGALALCITHVLGFTLSPHATTLLAAPSQQNRCGSLVLLAKKDGWSIGKARKTGKTSRDKVAKPQGRGFGAPSASEAAPKKPQVAADPGDGATRMAPADLNANDLAEAAAAAGGDTWRAYADEALAQVAALEKEAEERRISAQELLARQAALEEAAARRGKSE